MSNIPLKTPRLAALTLAWIFGVIGGAVGINAVVKRNQEVSRVKGLVAATGVTLWVDTWDLLLPGIVLATGCAVLSVVASLWLGLIALDTHKASTRPLSSRFLLFEWTSMAFMTVWIFACNIPVINTAVNGHVHTRAFLPSGDELPPSLVAVTEARLGVDSAYWSRGFVRLQVIPPWFAFLFALIATVVSFLAYKRRNIGAFDRHPDTVAPATTNETKSSSSPTNEKAAAEQQETV